MQRFLVDGEPDPREFERVVGGLIREAAAAGRPVRVYGEMVALLWDAGHVNAAIALEDLWNRLARELPFSLLCAYPAASVAGEAHADALGELCRLHSTVVGAPEAATRAFARALDAPRAARRFATELLAPTERAELVADARLVVSELAANAVVHARSDFGVTLSLAGGVLRISVRDASPAPPSAGEPTPTDTSGRGLAMVATTAHAWGWEPLDDGKVVWAELRR